MKMLLNILGVELKETTTTTTRKIDTSTKDLLQFANLL